MNVAYIDNQNLYAATQNNPDDVWDIDMEKFFIYLRDKYQVGRAYLFMGAFVQDYQDLYQTFMSFGYILDFRAHGLLMEGKKKGNVDTDIVFSMMRDAYEYKDSVGKLVLVSGDGDYYRTVQHLVMADRFETVLFPSHKNASSLYKRLSGRYKNYLDDPEVRKKFIRA